MQRLIGLAALVALIGLAYNATAVLPHTPALPLRVPAPNAPRVVSDAAAVVGKPNDGIAALPVRQSGAVAARNALPQI